MARLYGGRSNKEELMSGIRMRSPRRFFAKTIAFIFSVAAFVTSAMATDSGSPPPDLSGQWGRDMLFFEPPPSGPGPVTSAVHKADGAIVARDPCCATGNPAAGSAIIPTRF
jgi:hypothetical protein